MTDLERAWHPAAGQFRLAHCLLQGMAELNALFPSRKQGPQEGTIGDTVHRAEGSGSDHNPNAAGVVRAWDIDVSGGDFDPNKLANYLQQQMQANPGLAFFGSKGYIIYNRRITAWTPWGQWVAYNGSDPHTQHIHVSVGASPAEYDNMEHWNLAAAFGKSAPPSRPIVNGPRGHVDVIAAAGPGKVRIAGWAYDPDEPTTSIVVHIYGDGKAITASLADKARSDVDKAVKISGNHGFDITLSVPAGVHTFTVYAINVGPATANPVIGQARVSIPAVPVSKPPVIQPPVHVTNFPVGADHLYFVRFPNAPKSPTAIYAWDGTYLTWLYPADYIALGRPVPADLDCRNSNIYNAQCTPGTRDPRK